MDGQAQPESVRARFRTFLNDDAAFRKFIQTCNVKSRKLGRFTYAQEERWNSFVASNPEFQSLMFDAVLAAFHVCHIHLKPLHRVSVPIRRGLNCVSLSRETEAQIAREAYYSVPFMLDSEAWGEATRMSVEHCEDCVARRQQIATDR